MRKAIYQNHQHYLTEAWSREPKASFKALREIVERRRGLRGLNVLDVGCATGEFLAYLSTNSAESQFVGVDVSKDVIDEARCRLPAARFLEASALSLPGDLLGRFDLVTSIGCMSIFDDTELEAFWDNLLAAAKPGGLVIVLSPLNEYGVDAIVRHRKRMHGRLGTWESGWNVYSIETIRDILSARGISAEFLRFELPFELQPKADPVRTWTIKTEHAERQLTNGLKLLVDHYFTVVESPAAKEYTNAGP